MARDNDQDSCTSAIFYVSLHAVSLALTGRPIIAAHNSQLLFTRLAEYLKKSKMVGHPGSKPCSRQQSNLIGLSAFLEKDSTFWPVSMLGEIRVARNPSRLKLL